MHLNFWTLALQAFNVIVLIWLLGHFLFRPVSALIAARRRATEAVLAEAKAERANAAVAAAELARTRQEFSDGLDRMRAEARAAVEAERATVLRQTEAEAARLREASASALARQREVLQRALERQAAELAVTIARKLLARLPARGVTLALIDSLVGVLAALPQAERRRLAASGVLDITAAAPLDKVDQAACRERLAAALGGALTLRFAVEPALLGGLELRGGDTLVRDSWRADLERIAEVLEDEESHGSRTSELA
jgi:F-type H+-transporting ATPase subunit b